MCVCAQGLCCLCNKLARHWFPPKTPSVLFRQDGANGAAVWMPYKLDAMSDKLEELTAARSAVLALEESDPAHDEAVLRLLKAEAAAGETFRGGSWCAVQPTRSCLA